MSSRLDRINDWPERARAAGYSVQRLARKAGVSVSSIQRYTREQFSVSPKELLVRVRMKRAPRLLQRSTVKVTGIELGYSHPQHFSRDFKAHYGCSPIEFTARQRKASETNRQQTAGLDTK